MLVSFSDARRQAVKHADRDDASLWHGSSELYDEGRIRWCRSPHGLACERGP
jgi:hypothetical protein